MSDHVRPILFVLLVLILATIACDGSEGGSTLYPKTMGWALVEGELTSHALARWREQFPMCAIVSYAARVGAEPPELAIKYECK